MITSHQAACCLLQSVTASAAELTPDPAPAFVHAYLSATLTYPYCGHDAVVVRTLAPTTTGPDEGVLNEDRHDGVAVWFDRFDVVVLRDAPPMPDLSPGECIAGIYGTCDSEPDCTTLSGHHRIVVEERERLLDELLERWCVCMAAAGWSPSSIGPWVIDFEPVSEGRFAGTLFTVGVLLR
jgi:hypothetical protein